MGKSIAVSIVLHSCVTALFVVAILSAGAQPVPCPPRPTCLTLPCRSSPVRFVVLDCAVDAADGTGVHPGPSNVAIEAASQEGLRAAAHAQQRLMRSRLEVLAGLRVHLLVSTQPVSALLTFLCIEAGLALVAGVEEEEARGLCHAAGICISSSAGQLQASGTCHGPASATPGLVNLGRLARLSDTTLCDPGVSGHAALQSASVGEAAGCYRLELSRTSTGLLIELPTQVVVKLAAVPL